MMAEYIERKALLKRAIEEKRFVFKMEDLAHEEVVFKTVYKDLAEFILGAPAADVAPVVRSEWEILTDDSGNEYMRCKQCGEEFYDGDNDTVDTKHNFCPNCGADMREG